MERAHGGDQANAQAALTGICDAQASFRDRV
jgi:hypothetical protein